AVDLNDQGSVAPEKVDLVCPDTRIHLGLGKAVAPAEADEEPLELAAGELGVADLFRADQPVESPAKGGAEPPLRNGAMQVAEGSGRIRQGEPQPSPDRPVSESDGAMKSDSGARPATSVTEKCHLDRAIRG